MSDHPDYSEQFTASGFDLGLYARQWARQNGFISMLSGEARDALVTDLVKHLTTELVRAKTNRLGQGFQPL